jgi:hypothetical protein
VVSNVESFVTQSESNPAPTTSLVSLIGFANADITAPVSAFSGPSLILWDVAARSTWAIVMVYAFFDWLIDFVDGIEFSYFWHRLILLCVG